MAKRIFIVFCLLFAVFAFCGADCYAIKETIVPTPIKAEDILRIKENGSKADIPVLGFPELDEKTKSMAEDICKKSDTPVTVDCDVFLSGRLISVLLREKTSGSEKYQSVVCDAKNGHIVKLSELVSESSPDEICAFAEGDGDFIVTLHGIGLCGEKTVKVIPLAQAALKYDVTDKNALFPWEKAIAFTFDDGPSKYTDTILDFLDKSGAKATFFILGSHVEANEARISRMKALGCELGCHGFSHTDMRKQSADAVKFEVEKTSELIYEACGEYPTVFRAPYGEFSASTKGIKLHRIKWSVDTLDWKSRNKQKVVDAILSCAKDGDIVLLHDIFGTSADAFCEAASELMKSGYRLVTVSELAGLSGKEPDMKTVYYKRK